MVSIGDAKGANLLYVVGSRRWFELSLATHWSDCDCCKSESIPLTKRIGFALGTTGDNFVVVEEDACLLVRIWFYGACYFFLVSFFFGGVVMRDTYIRVHVCLERKFFSHTRAHKRNRRIFFIRTNQEFLLFPIRSSKDDDD